MPSSAPLRAVTPAPSRRPPLTYEEAAAACQTLLARGQKPSVNLVRDMVGGSPRVLCGFLRTWHATQRENREAERRNGGPPGEVLDAMRGWVNQCVTDAMAEHQERLAQAEAQVGALEAACNDEEERARALAAELAESSRRAEEERRAQAEALATAIARLGDQDKALANLQQLLQQSQNEAAALRQSCAEATIRGEMQRDRARALEKSHHEQRELVETLRQQLSAAERRADVAEGRAQLREEQVKNADANSRRLTEQLEKREEAWQGAVAREQEAVRLAQEQKTATALAQQKLAALEAKHEALEHQLEETAREANLQRKKNSAASAARLTAARAAQPQQRESTTGDGGG